MANNFHSIKANLYPNVLTESPNDFVAKVISERTLEISDVCHSAVGRGKADTTVGAMEHNVNLFFEEMAYSFMRWLFHQYRLLFCPGTPKGRL